MSRLLAVLGLVLLALLLVGAAVGWLAYGTHAPRAGTVEVDGMARGATVAWPDSGGVVVEAASLADLAAGLGYAHAADHAWAMAWLRRSALGTTEAWLGSGHRASDLHARRLGFADGARSAYRALAPDDRALLDAYAAGVNRALAEPGVAQSTPFLVRGVTPEPWAPWDALAVERLLAWAGTDAPHADSSWAAARASSAQVRAFARADSAFRATVGLDAASHGRVFVAPTTQGPALVQHHVVGPSADDLVAPVLLHIGGRTTAALTVPGTLLVPGGMRADGAWGTLLSSRATIAPHAGALPPVVHSRIVERDGSERLLQVRRDSLALVVGRAAAAPVRRDTLAPVAADTAASAGPGTPAAAAAPTGLWRIAWAGFGSATDAPAQFRMAAGGPLPAARLFAGTGLTLGADGGIGATGSPRVAVRVGDAAALVSDAPAAREAAARLSVFATAPAPAERLVVDAVSPPDVRRLRALLDAMGNRDSLAQVLQEPYSYLASWDGAYTPDAIGATLLAAWLDAHESVTGYPPAPADSLDRVLLPYTLRLARAMLRDRHGHDPATWRWGRFQPGIAYPVLGERTGVVARPFRLVDQGDGGHPTALRPGPEAATDGAMAVWTMWALPGEGAFFVRAPRRLRVTDDAFERPAERAGRTVALHLDAPAPPVRLTLRPAP